MTPAKSSLHVSPQLSLPLQTVTETIGILAVKRAGKSNVGVVMAEEMFDLRLPWVAIDPKGDWWGIRSSADGRGPGLPVLVFGGLHGDIPLEPTAAAGELVADLIVDQRLTCVLDVSEMSKAGQRRFLLAFALRLYKRNREPLHVFCEEADEYIPQGFTSRGMGNEDIAALVGAFEQLVKRGGFRGIGITLITQRSAALNKDVLTQIGTLIALRTPSPQDRKAIREWLEYHVGAVEIVKELPGLANGEAYISSPEFLKLLKRIRFRRRRTFDSGETPKVGQRRREPTTSADVDKDAITAAMAETIERAKADDPVELRKQITRLTTKVRDLEAVDPPAPEQVEVTPAPVQDGMRGAIQRLGALDEALEELRNLRSFLGTLLVAAEAEPKVTANRTSPAPKAPRTPPELGQRVTVDGTPAPTSEASNGTTVVNGVKIGKGERKVLSALGQFDGEMSHDRLAFLAGYSASASTLDVVLSRLRQAGLVEHGARRLTPDGAALANVEPLPHGRELLDYWMGHRRMGKGEKTVLGVLVEHYPRPLSHEEICELTGYSPDASTIGVILSRLRKLGLVAERERRLHAEFAESIEL